MTEYNKIAGGAFTTSAASYSVNLPFVAQEINIINQSAYPNALNNLVVSARWDSSEGGYWTGMKWNSSGTSSPTTYYFQAAYGTNAAISVFVNNSTQVFGPQQQVIGATTGNPNTSFNVASHGYISGDVVVFEGLYAPGRTTGMPQICGIPFLVTVTDANNFTVQWNTDQSNYANLTSSPTGAFVKQILNPDMYIPDVGYIIAIGIGNSALISCSAPTTFSVGSQVAFRIPPIWGTTQLNAGSNPFVPGLITYATVTQLVTPTQFYVNVNSTNFTAFYTNIPVRSVPGLSFAQVLAVGDTNSGGGPVVVYPQVGAPTTINGPAITGSFANNTSQGFTVTAPILNAGSSNNYSWTAFAYDIQINTIT